MTEEKCLNDEDLENYLNNDVSLNDNDFSDYAYKFSKEMKDIDLDNDNDNEDPLDNLKKIFFDFTCDLLKTYPELSENLDNKLLFILNYTKNDDKDKEKLKQCIVELKEFCLNIYPEKFFDILYQNDKIFSQETPLLLLPGIDFTLLWKENISDNTRETIWKYLQLILFTIISDISDSSSFGDTAKLFEAINQDEFKSKIEETINQMHSCFDISGATDVSNINLNDLPDADFINDHVSSMMDGKLGNLEKEIAEETAKDMDIDMENETNVGDVFQKLLKEPNKLMNLVQKVGGKLDEKLKSGEIKESELMEEASDLMKKMKSMPGVKNMEQIFSKMGMPTGKNSKVNFNAMQSNLQRNIKLSKQKEKLRAKLEKRRQQKEQKQQQKFTHSTYNPNSEKVQKSFINKPGEEPITKKRKKRKKKKKKKEQ